MDGGGAIPRTHRIERKRGFCGIPLLMNDPEWPLAKPPLWSTSWERVDCGNCLRVRAARLKR